MEDQTSFFDNHELMNVNFLKGDWREEVVLLGGGLRIGLGSGDGW